MPVTIQPTFGTFAYETNDVSVERWDDELGFSPVVVSIPRSDRGRDADGFLRPRQVRLSGIIGDEAWTSQDDLRTALDAFRYAHRPGRRNLYRDSDRYLKNAQVESLRLKDESLLWQEFDLSFVAADPYWYATSADADTWNTPANGNTRTLNNGGAATALPIFTVTVSATGDLSLMLTNNATGESFEIDTLPVTSGQALVIDCDAQTCKLAGTNKMSYLSGEFFALDPGNNELQLTLSGVTLTSIGTAWTKRWL